MTAPNTYEDILYKFHEQVEDDDDDEVLIAPKRPLRNFFIITSPQPDFIYWAAELASSYGFDYDLENSMLAGKVIAWPSKDSDNQILLENLVDDDIDFKIRIGRNIRDVLRDHSARQ